MNLASAYLALGAVTTVGFGVAYAVRAPQMARMVGIDVPSNSARADYRAIYAGSQIGIGLFFAVAAFRPTWVQPALAALALFAGGFGVARLASLVVERAGWQAQWIVGALEILAGGIAAWVLRQTAAS